MVYFKAGRSKRIAAAGVILMFLSGICSAQIVNPALPERGGMKIAEVKAHAALTTSAKYDSNIFLSPSDEKSDLIMQMNPSVGVELPLRDNSLALEYNAFINEYARHDKENHVDHALEALGKIALTDYTISVSDMFQRFTNNRNNETSVRLRQMTNKARVGVISQFDQLGFDVGYSHEVSRYLSDAPFFGALVYKDRDSVTHAIDATVSYRFWPKTSVLLETDAGLINYDSTLSPDARFIQVLTGLKGDLHENLSLNVKAGVKHQAYDSSALLNDKSFTGMVVKGGADYSLSADDKLSLVLERGLYESIYQNMNYYTLNQIGLDYKHDFTRKLSGGLSGAYQVNDYPTQSTEGAETKKRSDGQLRLGSRLTYNIRKWVAVGLDYAYTQRDSNFSIYGYKDHQIMLKMTIGF
jgi:hypothetical protein